MNRNMPGVGPIGQAIIERDIQSISPSLTRPYPFVASHARGSELWDVDGRRYVDFMAGIGVLNAGHQHPAIVEAVKEQIDKFWHVCLSDFYYPQAVELAEKLQEIAPMPDTRIYFGNSGAEAVEAAIKLAMYKTGRRQFIGFMGAFHGRTLGALSFTSSKYTQRAKYKMGLPVHHLPYPNAYRPILAGTEGKDYGDVIIDYLEKTIFKSLFPAEDVAAILVEPVLGEGGYVIPTPNFFPRLRKLCDESGILLIVDEIQSGIGRTGKWWSVEHEGVEPDIVCFAKGVGSGMPIGGIIARREVMTWGPGSHGSTFGGNPVAAAAAIATLNVIEKEGLMQQANETGAYVMDAMAELQSRHPSIGQVRGRGLMIGVEFVKDHETKERADDIREATIQNAFEKGLLMLQCGSNTIRLTPPLNISRDLVDEGLEIFSESIAEAEAKLL